MSSEASLIAKKINDQLYIRNLPDPEPQFDSSNESLWKTIASVLLMMVVVRLTKASLYLTRIVQKLDVKA